MIDKEEKFISTGRYLVSLLKADLTGAEPPFLPESVSWEDVFYLARRHCVETMSYTSVCRLDIDFNADVFKQWKEQSSINTAKNLVQIEERDRIVSCLTGSGVDVLPLKGSIMIDLYPRRDQRQMSDLDILFPMNQEDTVRKCMESLDYHVKKYGITNEDSYTKDPFMHVEMHHELFSGMMPHEKLKEYYKDPWKNARSSPEHPHLFSLSWDDYYVYLIAHLFKHYSASGCGIRNIMDIFVLRSVHGGELHETYLTRELGKLNLDGFRRQMETLADSWFGDDTAATPDSLYDAEVRIISSGAFGTKRNARRAFLHRLENKYRNPAFVKAAYIRFYLFPSFDRMQMKYPQFKGKRMLLPFLWLYQFGDMMMHKRDKIIPYLRVLRKNDPSEDRQ